MQTRGRWKWNNFSFRDEQLGPDEGKSLWEFCPQVLQVDPSVGSVFYDDFFQVPDVTYKYALTEDAGKTGPDVLADAVGGIYEHFCDGDNEDESYLRTIKEFWIPRAGKPIFFEAKVIPTEGNVAGNTANFIVGLMAAGGAADSMQNAGAGPPANYDGIVWYKRDANMFWEFETSLAGAQTTKADLKAHVSGVGHRLGFIIWTPKTTDTTVLVYPVFDGVIDEVNVCTLTIAGLTEMNFFFGVKNGSAAGGLEEKIAIDYVKIVQPR